MPLFINAPFLLSILPCIPPSLLVFLCPSILPPSLSSSLPFLEQIDEAQKNEVCFRNNELLSGRDGECTNLRLLDHGFN